MKKNLYFIILFVLTALISLGQQVPREEVILEIGTGTWCQYCPGAAKGADDLIANGHDVGVIEYHSGDPYQNAASSGRLSYYSIGSFPTAKFDGVLTKAGGSATQSMYSQYLPLYNQRIVIPSSFTIDIFGTHIGQTYDIPLVVKTVADFTGTNLVVQLALTESHIPENWFGMTEVNFVCRKMAPTHTGTAINLEVGQDTVIELSFTISAMYVTENCELVAFVQNNTSKEIAQGAKVMLEDLNPYVPPLLADFSVSDTMPCINAFVNFIDESQGHISFYNWEFYGGIPETSSERYPLVYYPEPGDYDVTLTVSNGLENVTTTKDNYMHVKVGPDVTFDAVEGQCVYFPPFELTQGLPEGGSYEGPGVDELGFFSPEIAGIGEHTLKYYYTSEEGCTDTAFQTVVVDACTNISENVSLTGHIYPNPNNGLFFIQFSNSGNIYLKIFNTSGQLVFENNYYAPTGTSVEIDAGTLPQGLYYLNATDENHETVIKRLLIQ